MWPLSIVFVIAMFFAHFMAGVSAKEQHVQDMRLRENTATMFRSYDAAGAAMLAAAPALTGAIDRARMAQALRDLHMGWVGVDGWCDGGAGAGKCRWGALADDGQFYVYRKDLGEGVLLNGVYHDLLVWTSGPDQMGFKSGSKLLDAGGAPILGKILPASVQRAVPDGSLIKIL